MKCLAFSLAGVLLLGSGSGVSAQMGEGCVEGRVWRMGATGSYWRPTALMSYPGADVSLTPLGSGSHNQLQPGLLTRTAGASGGFTFMVPAGEYLVSCGDQQRRVAVREGETQELDLLQGNEAGSTELLATQSVQRWLPVSLDDDRAPLAVRHSELLYDATTLFSNGYFAVVSQSIDESSRLFELRALLVNTSGREVVKVDLEVSLRNPNFQLRKPLHWQGLLQPGARCELSDVLSFPELALDSSRLRVVGVEFSNGWRWTSAHTEVGRD